MKMSEGMELWAIVPELIVAGGVLLLLPIGPFLPPRAKAATTWMALVVLAAAGLATLQMVPWHAQDVFDGTYAVDPFAIFFKVFAIATTAMVLLATVSRFRGAPHESDVPALLLLACLGMIGLAASQDLVLITVFLTLSTVGSYILAGIVKDDLRSTEAAMKLFLMSAASGAVMVYGMTFMFGLAGSLRLHAIAGASPNVPRFTLAAILGLILVGYGYKVTFVPFHFWVPDVYQGAPTPITAYLAVASKAAGFAVLVRTLLVAFPGNAGGWAEGMIVVAVVTMTVGNLLALRQTSVKRLLAYSAIAQGGYVLVGVAALERDAIAGPSVLFYLLVYFFMTLAAFLAVDAIERSVGSDDISSFGGLGRRLPLSSAVLTLALLSLAGFPPFGGFVGKAMLFGAAIAAQWTWAAVILAANTAISLYYYVRVIEAMYLRPGEGEIAREPPLLRFALVTLGVGTLLTGIVPEPWLAFATRCARLLHAG